MLDPKVILLIVCLAGPTVWAQDSQVISDASDVNHKQIIYNKPIVIHTQLDNYEQPTLREYQECHDNAQKCRTVCQGVDKVEACEKQCPICPELIIEEKVVQGVNDTLMAPQPPPLNTTNIIRLTNQIQNIIDNSRGNITFRNENILHVQQNVSRVGGKFGLGYSDTDPCCIVMHFKRKCDKQKFSTSARCHHKRHRACGPHCKARVMLSKEVTECEQPDPMDYFAGMAETNCRKTLKYVPYQHRSAAPARNKCNYTPYWPYVACSHNQHQAAVAASCSRCMHLPYGYILRNGIPLQCQPCFRSLSAPNFGYGSYSPSMWYPGLAPPMFDSPVVDNEFNYETTGDWTPDKVKCISSEGTITDDCPQTEEGSGVDMPVTHGPEIVVDDYADDYLYYSEDPVPRTRRHTFARSKYSRRNRQ